MKRAALAAVIPLALLAPSVGSASAWRSCPRGSGGAFDTRVIGISCSYARQVTEDGLTAHLRSTRLGHMTCTRSRSRELWSYRCVHGHGREQLDFDTF
jgi:hypothetical protein